MLPKSPWDKNIFSNDYVSLGISHSYRVGKAFLEEGVPVQETFSRNVETQYFSLFLWDALTHKRLVAARLSTLYVTNRSTLCLFMSENCLLDCRDMHYPPRRHLGKSKIKSVSFAVVSLTHMPLYVTLPQMSQSVYSATPYCNFPLIVLVILLNNSDIFIAGGELWQERA